MADAEAVEHWATTGNQQEDRTQDRETGKHRHHNLVGQTGQEMPIIQIGQSACGW